MPKSLCGPYVGLDIKLAPVIRTDVGISGGDHAFSCLAWQSFIYLNWPAKAPGEPDPGARLRRSRNPRLGDL